MDRYSIFDEEYASTACWSPREANKAIERAATTTPITSSGRPSSKQKSDDPSRLGKATHRPASAQLEVIEGQSRGGGNDLRASQSHRKNDEYLEAFDHAFREMQMVSGNQLDDVSGSAATITQRLSGNVSTSGHGPRARDVESLSERLDQPHHETEVAPPSRKRLGTLDPRETEAVGQEGITTTSPSLSWTKGPRNEEGHVVQLANSNILCMSACRGTGEVAVGSADHAAYALNIESCLQTRRLYSKTSGHSEWVTAICHLPDGRLVSGGMDSKICLWPSAPSNCQQKLGARNLGKSATKTTHSTISNCVDLLGHTASVSGLQVIPFAPGSKVLSSSYDKTLRVWTIPDSVNFRRSKQRLESSITLLGHKAPVLNMALSCNHVLCSGDREGAVLLWDLQRGQCQGKLMAATKDTGHVTALRFLHLQVGTETENEDLELCHTILGGYQDGHVRVFDVRCGSSRQRPIFDVVLHSNETGRGAVNNIAAVGRGATSLERVCGTSVIPAGPHRVISAGADGGIKILDPRMNFKDIFSFYHHNTFIYSLRCHGSLIFSGAGDGMVLAHDAVEGKLLYGLKGMKNAVRDIAVMDNKMVVAGDDGVAIIYEFD